MKSYSIKLMQKIINVYHSEPISQKQLVKMAQKKLKQWLNYASIFFKEAAVTIINHFEGICNYFLNRTTSRVMEGMNNRIKLIMRQRYGFSNFNNFRDRVLACFSN